jgi:hypothetical protein
MILWMAIDFARTEKSEFADWLHPLDHSRRTYLHTTECHTIALKLFRAFRISMIDDSNQATENAGETGRRVCRVTEKCYGLVKLGKGNS